MKKTEKTFFVQNLAEEFKSASASVLVDYSGMSVKSQQELKKRLALVNARMFVAKNTLIKLAGKEAKLPDEAFEDTQIEGPTALILTEEDPIAPLQVLAKFAKEFDIPQLKVGIVEGSFQNKDSLVRLSKLPGKDVLFAQVVGGIAAPMYGIVGTLQGKIQELLYILSEKAKQ